MTNEELANHWGISLKEVQRISDFVNAHYSVRLVPKMENGHEKWDVKLFAFDGKNWYISTEMPKTFSNKKQAIIQGSRWAQNMKLFPNQAKQMDGGIPVDAYLALKPIDGCENVCKKSLTRNVVKTYQRD